MDPKRQKKEEGKQAKTADPLEVQSILFEIALGLSVGEIIAWCNLNKFFAKMCETHFPEEKLYELGLLDLEVLLNETITGAPHRSAEERTKYRKNELPRRKKEVVRTAKDLNDTVFSNEPESLALHKAMLSTRESLVFFLRRLDVYFGFAKNEVWERFPDNGKVTETPLSLVKVRKREMGTGTMRTSIPGPGEWEYTWVFRNVLIHKDPYMSGPSGQEPTDKSEREQIIELVENEMKICQICHGTLPQRCKAHQKRCTHDPGIVSGSKIHFF